MKSSVEFTMSMIRSRANLWDLDDAVGSSVKQPASYPGTLLARTMRKVVCIIADDRHLFCR